MEHLEHLDVHSVQPPRTILHQRTARCPCVAPDPAAPAVAVEPGAGALSQVK